MCNVCIYASSSHSAILANRIRCIPAAIKTFPQTRSIQKKLHNKCWFCICWYHFLAIAIQWIALSNNEFTKLNHRQRRRKNPNGSEKRNRTSGQKKCDWDCDWRCEANKKIEFWWKSVHTINEFCRSFAFDFCLLHQLYIYLFRLISYPINQFHHVLKFLWCISFESHSIFFVEKLN